MMLIPIVLLALAPSPSAYFAADKAYANCVALQARRLDNGQDKAADVAEAAIEKCGGPQMRLWQARHDYLANSGSDWPRKEANEYMEGRYGDLRRIAIADILSRRASRRKK
jgi:hypothetical protein